MPLKKFAFWLAFYSLATFVMIFSVNAAEDKDFAATRTSVKEAIVINDGHDLLVKTFEKGDYQTDVEYVKIVLDKNLDGTYAAFRTWQKPPKDRDGLTRAWLCNEITVYVRSEDVKRGWDFVLNQAKRKSRGPDDIVPKIR